MAENLPWKEVPVCRGPKLFGHISGDIILFVSSKRRGLEARNFAVILNLIPFTTYEKTSFAEWVGSEFYEWLFGTFEKQATGRYVGRW